ncbi:DUF4166 domain-containing protein [Actinomadura alba]|uniref:DUF4166 domain-containing protein n=1 Tax=Actinomadura alba TaxID=406431 RepID=A0ABR7LTT6_9ACTN|nr:DUF4166 domain-containing protein [Actinomadura alba]MBC6468180.1 DUF4166 domain-containing protein [Actinomadura alba]
MNSIFQRALGRDFGRLHPELRRRLGVGVAGGQACIGNGVMDRVWHGAPFTRPFLALGSRRNILVPETGRAVPFVIENYPYIDSHGRETVTFVRTFQLPRRPRRFDATMIYNSARGCVVDYLGTHQHLATDLLFEVDERGGLVIRSGEYRFREGPLAFRVPDLVTGAATVRESFDDEIGRFRIDVRVVNHRCGPLFGYHGTFTTRYVPASGVPTTVKPRREQARR